MPMGESMDSDSEMLPVSASRGQSAESSKLREQEKAVPKDRLFLKS